MMTIRLEDLLARIEARKKALGMTDTPAEVEALRNSGLNRTPEKRELLRRMEQRAIEAGVKPVPAHY
jgi:hypothetical protein